MKKKKMQKKFEEDDFKNTFQTIKKNYHKDIQKVGSDDDSECFIPNHE
jgi:hypothetical protein